MGNKISTACSSSWRLLELQTEPVKDEEAAFIAAFAEFKNLSKKKK
jgi:hypothetical protein